MICRFQTPMNLVSALVAFSLAIPFAGCGPSGPKLYKVTGKVTIDGKPARSAMIIFNSADGADSAAADLSDEGEFEMMTGGARSGLVPGRYSVQIIRVEGGSVEEGEEEAPPSNVPAKYGEETSDLTADVKEEDNIINFPLVSS
ncbi:MAG: hypothetical protein QGF59_25250 [Pirellulaceae bacterium]|nr:hypothetical protein [Pirellulaceae bacterium]